MLLLLLDFRKSGAQGLASISRLAFFASNVASIKFLPVFERVLDLQLRGRFLQREVHNMPLNCRSQRSRRAAVVRATAIDVAARLRIAENCICPYALLGELPHAERGAACRNASAVMSGMASRPMRPALRNLP